MKNEDISLTATFIFYILFWIKAKQSPHVKMYLKMENKTKTRFFTDFLTCKTVTVVLSFQINKLKKHGIKNVSTRTLYALLHDSIE